MLTFLDSNPPVPPNSLRRQSQPPHQGPWATWSISSLSDSCRLPHQAFCSSLLTIPSDAKIFCAPEPLLLLACPFSTSHSPHPFLQVCAQRSLVREVFPDNPEEYPHSFTGPLPCVMSLHSKNP